MRVGGLTTIQQTLTAEASSVLTYSIAEAGRRNHGQTTPLHVAATLLSSPTGFLRQACIKSHPNSSHPLQCRALELCFSVALERLPTRNNISPSSSPEPPISNALMAALKRAQAHQRRGCPEQQQQPLLAVKVELEQLVISILDDPSVSRVMREASFSSPAVKATIEQSLTNSSSASSATMMTSSSPIGLGFRPAGPPVGGHNMYLNPRLQGRNRDEEVTKVIDIFARGKKRNPVLVGDSEPEAVTKEVLRRIRSGELGEGELRNAEIIHLEKELCFERGQNMLKDLMGLVEKRMVGSSGRGIILDLGDLKWLVEQPATGLGGGQQQVVWEPGRAAVAEMVKVLGRFGSGLWLIGTATCETYLRCQVYHPSMEADWDLQAVPIAARTPLSGLFPRMGTMNGILSSSVESLSLLKGFQTAHQRPVTENLDPARRRSCCPQCTETCEQEVAKLLSKESEKSSSESNSEAVQPALPQWLQNAKSEESNVKTSDLLQTKSQDQTLNEKSQQIRKEWKDACMRLHPNFHQHSFSSERIATQSISVTSMYNMNLLGRQHSQSKPQPNKSFGTLQLNTNLQTSRLSKNAANSHPQSPVRTDLVLGQKELAGITAPDEMHKERAEDFMGSIPSEPQNKLLERKTDDKQLCQLDADSFKKLYKGLMEVWWQQEAATTVASTITNCKLGIGKRLGAGARGDMWLLFMGPDIVGKKKMASALSEIVSGSTPIMISLNSKRGSWDSDMGFRGKTVVDRIAETVRRNPFSVIVLEDINEADMIVHGSIRRAMERGRLADSYGREISLGNVIFLLTANWLPENLKHLTKGDSLEEKLACIGRSGWQLKLSVCGRSTKRRATWLQSDEDRITKPRKDASSGLGFDLNEAADTEDCRMDGSLNSSDLTVDHDDEKRHNNRSLLTSTPSSAPREFLDSVDNAIVFKPVDFDPIRKNITNSISRRFTMIVGDKVPLELQDDTVEKILSGIWLGKTGLDEWTEKVLVPSFQQLKSRLGVTLDESMVVRLEADGDSGCRRQGDWLPSSISVVTDGLRQ